MAQARKYTAEALKRSNGAVKSTEFKSATGVPRLRGTRDHHSRQQDTQGPT